MQSVKYYSVSEKHFLTWQQEKSQQAEAPDFNYDRKLELSKKVDSFNSCFLDPWQMRVKIALLTYIGIKIAVGKDIAREISLRILNFPIQIDKIVLYDTFTYQFYVFSEKEILWKRCEAVEVDSNSFIKHVSYEDAADREVFHSCYVCQRPMIEFYLYGESFFCPFHGIDKTCRTCGQIVSSFPSLDMSCFRGKRDTLVGITCGSIGFQIREFIVTKENIDDVIRE